MNLVDVSTKNLMQSNGALHAVRLVYALLLSACLDSPLFGVEEAANDTVQHEEPYRPANGKFPPLDKSYSYRGELIFVDHANRRGSIRVQGDGKFYRNDPHPFAMLPYGIVRYHNAPADLRDVPLGTVMHARGYLPPDPSRSRVPVLNVDSKEQDAGHYRGTGIFPAENHLLLLEDEPSYCLRNGLAWTIRQVTTGEEKGTILASRQRKIDPDSDAPVESLTFDRATRLWRGRERLRIGELVAEGKWPADGTRKFDNFSVLLGVTWKPGPGDGLSGDFTRFHVSDIWLDNESIQSASHFQNETHKAFIRSRWMPAWVDSVEYGKFGSATVTLALFGGMDKSLYAAFQEGESGQVNAAEDTLKHTAGHYGPSHMASSGTIVEVRKIVDPVALGDSGVRLKFETDLIIEGIRPGRVVRVRPNAWPKTQIPREEYLFQNTPENRFPNADIFPKY